jgi:DNA (cytosine-5)-methyltransferase 1
MMSSEAKQPLSYEKKLPQPQFVYVIDFFCGCGGMSYGLANTRQSHLAYKVLAGFDIDKLALETYAANIEARAICMDLRKLAANPQELRELVPEFDPEKCRPLLFVGCAPCQGFSAHRKKDRRDDPRNSLMMAFAKICGAFRPDFVVMENVPEILNGRFRAYFDEAAKTLEQSKYALTKGIVDMSLYGVPQKRKRAIVLGTLTPNLQIPQPLFGRKSVITVRDAIAHLNPIEAGQADKFDLMHRAPHHTQQILRRIQKTPPDGGDRRNIPDDEQLRCHTAIDNGNSPGFTDVYGRLRWDTPGVTITAKSSTPSCGRFLHPEQHRNISVREAAILQGFPQSYVFKGNFIHMYRQIGEAVPPIFARSLGWQILTSIRQQDHIPPLLTKIYREKPTALTESISEQTLVSVVDYFCGAGGIALGFEAAGFRVAFAFDNDSDCVSTFARNISRNVMKLDIQSENARSYIKRNLPPSPYVVAGGPPCQGFSQQRRGADEDPRNNLVLKFGESILGQKRLPVAIVLENVTYLDSPRGRDVLNKYFTMMEKAGYKHFRHDMNSADYAVPQLRNRIVIVCLRSDVAQYYEAPKPLTPHRWRTIGETIGGLLEDPHQPDVFSFVAANHTPSKDGPQNKRRIAFVDMGRGRLCIPPNLQLPCHRRYDGHLDVYGRLDWFSQARTVTGGFDSFTRGEYAHPFIHRSITPREAARIQGFPDWFIFTGNRCALRHQIGNAVPPPLAFSIGKAILRSLIKAGLIKEV